MVIAGDVLILTFTFCGSVIFFVIIELIGAVVKACSIFKDDPTNPYRRICKKCGDRQGLFSWSWKNSEQWWETLEYGQADPECSCHRHETYKSEFG